MLVKSDCHPLLSSLLAPYVSPYRERTLRWIHLTTPLTKMSTSNPLSWVRHLRSLQVHSPLAPATHRTMIQYSISCRWIQ